MTIQPFAHRQSRGMFEIVRNPLFSMSLNARSFTACHPVQDMGPIQLRSDHNTSSDNVVHNMKFRLIYNINMHIFLITKLEEQ